MKLAVQEGMLPGKTLVEKMNNCKKFGYEGVEFWGSGLAARVDEIKAACAKTGVAASTICAGYPGCPLDASKEERDRAFNGCLELLEVAGEIGAVGLIFVPIFGGPRVPDLSPFKTAVETETEILVRLCKQLAKKAEKCKTLLLLEPLNRYETHLLCRLEQGVEICERVNAPGIAIMADFFHMAIEEQRIDKSIEKAAKWIAHFHLADSIRWLPGYGHTDFKSGFAAVKKIKFRNYMALECHIPGDPLVELPKCAKYLKGCM
jgi:sugar phosphate isomerase/epimerase